MTETNSCDRIDLFMLSTSQREHRLVHFTAIMEAFSSFQSLSSVAVWPVLMMNWRSIVAYFPAVGRFIDGLNVDVLMQMVFGTRLGLSGLGILTSLALAHFAYSAYLALRNIALTTCYTKCAISEHSSMHDQLLEWIMRNPKFQSVSTGEIVMKFDEDIEIPDDEEDIDVSRMMNEIVSFVEWSGRRASREILTNGVLFRRQVCDQI